MVIPVGSSIRAQELVRVTRESETTFRTENIADVRFVPLIGEEGWTIPDVQGEIPEPVKGMPARVEPSDELL